MGMLFKAGNDFAIATHNTRLIEEAERLSKENEKQFESALLKGTRDDFERETCRSGLPAERVHTLRARRVQLQQKKNTRKKKKYPPTSKVHYRIG